MNTQDTISKIETPDTINTIKIERGIEETISSIDLQLEVIKGEAQKFPEGSKEWERLVQLASVPEAVDGTNQTKAVTPEGLLAALANIDLKDFAAKGVIDSLEDPPVDAGLYLIPSEDSGAEPALVIALPIHEISQTVQFSQRLVLIYDEADGARVISYQVNVRQYQNGSWGDWGNWQQRTSFLDEVKTHRLISERIATTSQAESGTSNFALMSPAKTVDAILYLRPIAAKSSGESGVDHTHIMTPLRTKEAIDYQRPFSTKEQAEAGTQNASVMTPLRVKEAIEALRKIADYDQARGGTDNTNVMTPLRTRQAINYNKEVFIEGALPGNGWFRMWRNGRYEEWGTSVSNSSTGTVQWSGESNAPLMVASARVIHSAKTNVRARYSSGASFISSKTFTGTYGPATGGDEPVTVDWYISGMMVDPPTP